MKAAQSTGGAAFLWLLGVAGLRVSEKAVLKFEHIDGPGCGKVHGLKEELKEIRAATN